MSANNKPPKKKVVVTTKKETPSPISKNQTASTGRPRRREKQDTKNAQPLIFGRSQYLLMLAGIGLITLGIFLMSGGKMPDPNTWDEDIIYSTRITVIAPLIIMAGLILEIVAIFKKSPAQS